MQPKNKHLLERKVSTSLSQKDRILLIRKGNSFFNDGFIEQARKIFITVGYQDGIMRIRDYYLEKNNFKEALKVDKQNFFNSFSGGIGKSFAEIIHWWMKG